MITISTDHHYFCITMTLYKHRVGVGGCWSWWQTCSGVLAQPTPTEEGVGRWSDAELAAQNPITALQIERRGDNLPCRIRARWETGCNLYLLQIRTRLGSMEKDQWLQSKGWQRGNPWSRSGYKPEDNIGHWEFRQQWWPHLDVKSSAAWWIQLGTTRTQ